MRWAPGAVSMFLGLGFGIPEQVGDVSLEVPLSHR
jgi:hypothetical protein